MGRRVVLPIGVHSRYREGIPDIFIPPTPMDNAGVMRGWNENSGMTTVMTTGGDRGIPVVCPLSSACAADSVCIQRGDFVVVFRVVADFFQPGAFACAGFFRVAALQ